MKSKEWSLTLAPGLVYIGAGAGGSVNLSGGVHFNFPGDRTPCTRLNAKQPPAAKICFNSRNNLRCFAPVPG